MLGFNHNILTTDNSYVVLIVLDMISQHPDFVVQKVLECCVKKTSDKTASLFCLKNSGRWTHGFEYAALEVQSHLERLLFSDIVSNVMIL